MRRHPWGCADRPLVFAHRGGSRLAPENTLAAFDRAIAERVDGLEMDVHLSKDGEVVVCHDATVDRTTDGKGPIAGMTARDLAAVDAGWHFSDGNGGRPFRGRGLGIPTLRDVVSRHPAVRLIVELKDNDVRLAEAALGVLSAHDALARTCLGSFHADVLAAVRRLQPEVATSGASSEVRWALYRSWFGLFPRSTAYQALQVPERREATRVVTPRFVRAAHRAGLAVQVWVVNEAEDMSRLLAWGVDGLITDRPDLAMQVVGKGLWAGD